MVAEQPEDPGGEFTVSNIPKGRPAPPRGASPPAMSKICAVKSRRVTHVASSFHTASYIHRTSCAPIIPSPSTSATRNQNLAASASALLSWNRHKRLQSSSVNIPETAPFPRP